jgi:hypothetical protein
VRVSSRAPEDVIAELLRHEARVLAAQPGLVWSGTAPDSYPPRSHGRNIGAGRHRGICGYDAGCYR